MPAIRPISDLRNNFNAISDLCHQENEAVFITRNGVGDMVVMSMAAYERQQATLALYEKLMEAQSQKEQGVPFIEHDEAMRRLRDKYHVK